MAQVDKSSSPMSKEDKGMEIVAEEEDKGKEIVAAGQDKGKEIVAAEEELEKEEEKHHKRIAYTMDWEDVKPELEEQILKSAAMSHLKVSYDNLETQLKLCFLCLSVFPPGAEIRKRVLIYWWIGEGLVTSTGDKSAEERGEACFFKLLDLGLISPCRCNGKKIVLSCQIHPWIRWILIAIARQTQFLDLDSRGLPDPHSTKSRRACLFRDEDDDRPYLRKLKAGDLFLLFNVNERYLKLRWEWFSELKKVAVLQLGRWQNSTKRHIVVDDAAHLKLLGSLKNLRFLSLRGISRVTEIPGSICKLIHLRILDLRACYSLQELPTGIKSLKNLTHLNVNECYMLDHLPKGLSSLRNLQVLKGFVVGSSVDKKSCRLTELSKLDRLRKLSIDIGSKALLMEGELNQLIKFKSLHSLTITWGEILPSPNNNSDSKLERASAVTTMVPPSNLKKLDLRCFPRNETPKWLTPQGLPLLQRLYIRGGPLSNLTIEGKWEKLEVLRLRFLEKLESDWLEMKRAFPLVNYVEIYRCPHLRSSPQLDEYGVWLKQGDDEDEEKARPRVV